MASEVAFVFLQEEGSFARDHGVLIDHQEVRMVWGFTTGTGKFQVATSNIYRKVAECKLGVKLYCEDLDDIKRVLQIGRVC